MPSILAPSFLLITSILLTLTSSNPLPGLPKRQPNTSPANSNPLTPRTPVSAEAFTDWATNVVMVGGSQSFGMWVPPDGTWYDLGNIQCLDEPAYAIGPCNSPTIDQIGVSTGNGPCSFVGYNGWSAKLSGAAGEGFQTVGPPQRIMQAACGQN